MLRIQVQTGQQRRTLEHAAGPLEFGRLNRPGHPRVVLDDPCVSRDQLRIQERPLGLLELENLSKGTVVYLDDGSTVAVQSRRQVRLPVRLTVGMTHIEIEVQEDPSTSTGTEGSWNTVDQPIRQSLAAGRSLSLSAMREDITPQTLAHWFETVISVQRAAAGSAEFYRETVRAVVDLVGLDYGAMLLARKQPDGTIRWEEAACYSGQADRHPEISRTVLDRVLLQKRTFYQGGEPMNITNSLTDAGPDSNNSIELTDGFHLLRKPRLGDLLGTRFWTRAPRFVSVAHTWAADNRGATPAGFTNNAAVGRLLLDSLAFGELRFGPPLDGLGYPQPGNFGLYVDYLEFSTNRYTGGQPSVAETPESYLVIEPGLTIYFAMSNLNPEELDGRFEGRLRWVKSYAGPASGADVALRDGRTLRVNLGLLQSLEIDSDGDGVVNGRDLYPFDDLLITNFHLVSVTPPVAELSWRAAARTSYAVSYTTNLLTPNWQVIARMANPAPEVRILTVTHRPEGGISIQDAQRYYRVSYEP